MTRWSKGDAYPSDWPQWLRDADIEWCDVDVAPSGVIWHGGAWYGGKWYAGTWYGGEWRGGVWHGGDWRGGEWRCRLDGRGDQIAAVAVAANWHGECGRTLRLWRCPERGRWLASCGCFVGTLGQLRDFIRKDVTHLRASRTRVLRAAIALARIHP